MGKRKRLVPEYRLQKAKCTNRFYVWGTHASSKNRAIKKESAGRINGVGAALYAALQVISRDSECLMKNNVILSDKLCNHSTWRKVGEIE